MLVKVVIVLSAVLVHLQFEKQIESTELLYSR